MKNFEDLPEVIWLKIFGFFNKKDLARVAQVSKRLNFISTYYSLKHLPSLLRNYAADFVKDKSTLLMDPRNSKIDHIVVLGNGRFLTFGSSGVLYEWDSKKNKPIRGVKIRDDWSLDDPGVLVPISNREIIVCIKNKISIWHLQQKKCVRELVGHTDSIQVAEFLPGMQLVTGSKDKTLRIWDLKTGECLHVLRGHKNTVQFIVVLPKLNVIVSAAKRSVPISSIGGELDTLIHVWNYNNGKCIGKFEGPQMDISILTRLDDYQIIAGYENKNLNIFDVKNQTTVNTLILPKGIPTHIAVLPNGRFACGAKESEAIYICNSKSSFPIHTIKIAEKDCRILVYLPGGYIICNGRYTTRNGYQLLDIREIDSWNCVRTLSIEKLELPDASGSFATVFEFEQIKSLAILPDGNFITGTSSNLFKLWKFPEPAPMNMNRVIVRVWLPTINGEPTWEPVITFRNGKKVINAGYVSIEIPSAYVSARPDEEGRTNMFNIHREQFRELVENEVTEFGKCFLTACFYSLDINKIEKAFNQVQKTQMGYVFTGNNNVIEEEGQSCWSLAYDFLQAGGIDKLTLNENSTITSTIVTSGHFLSFITEAKYQELEEHPEVNNFERLEGEYIPEKKSSTCIIS